MAKKLQSSLTVEGELPEEGLAAYGDDGDDLMMALACQIVGGEEEDTAETMEEVFAAVRDAEATAEELLVDEHWKLVEIEPQAVEVNGNSHHSYGHDAIGPTVELVLDNGRHANGNGHAHVRFNGNGANGHHDEAGEPQRSLFPWAEFMTEEPVKPKGRRGKPQPATASLFAWALTLEQEREAEPVDAGR